MVKNFFDQSVNNEFKHMKTLEKMLQGDYYTTGCLLDLSQFNCNRFK